MLLAQMKWNFDEKWPNFAKCYIARQTDIHSTTLAKITLVSWIKYECIQGKEIGQWVECNASRE